MVAQDIYISPRQILSYLRTFEEKLLIAQKDYYRPSLSITPISEEALNNEAKKMMSFVGLSEYTPKCTWEVTSEGTGGNVTLNNNPDKIVRVRVSLSYQNNLAATLAILAHEICHKLLFCYGLHYPIDIINEINTDLCTMYVGFGRLILNGYITNTSYESQVGNRVYNNTTTHYLGYLNFRHYEQTLNLLRLIKWNEQDNGAVEAEKDPILQEAYILWNKSEDKREVAKATFEYGTGASAEFMRNTLLAEKLIQLLNNQHQSHLENADKLFYKPEWFNEVGLNRNSRIAAFSSIYESVLMHDAFNDACLQNARRHMESLIVELNSAIKGTPIGPHSANKSLLQIGVVKCPFCGHSANVKSGRVGIVKCPDCKKRFYMDTLVFPYDRTALNDERIIQRRIKELEEKHQKEIKTLREEMQKEVKLAFQKGIDQEVTRYSALRKKINQLPGWLKSLIGKRLD